MRVCCLGSGLEGAAARLEAAGNDVVRDPATGSVGTAAENAGLVLTLLAGDAAVRRVYAELARTATAGQVFVDHSPAASATHRWCALALPAFLAARLAPSGALRVRGEAPHLERVRPLLRVYAPRVIYAGSFQGGLAGARRGR